MPIQEFFEPVTLDEASSLAMESGLPAKFLGGGTDLMIQLKATKTLPLRLISLKRIRELRQIEEYSSGEIFVGALVSHSALSVHPEIVRHFPALARACSLVGSPSIRNMGTVGGNICNFSPAADTAPPLLAYDAGLVVWQNGSEVRIKMTDFFQGPGENALRQGDILKGFLLMKMDGYSSSYEKLGYRKAMEIGIVNVCVAMKREGSLCRDIRIALGSVAPTPIRALRAEETLRGKEIDDVLLKMAAEKALEEITPITDMRASADYRRAMTRVLIEKTVRGMLDKSF